MWNDIDYDFVAFDLPNLGWAKSKTKPPTVPVLLSTNLAPLAHAAAKKFPNWKFVGSPVWGRNPVARAAAFTEVGALSVYEGRENLGTLGFFGDKFVIRNERIKKTHLSGEARPASVPTALRLMTKMFKVQTLEEKSMEAYRKLSKALDSSHCGIAQSYVMALDTCLKMLGAYVLNNFEAMSAAAIAAGAPAGVVNSIPSLKEDLDTVSTVHNAFAGGRGQYFMLDGSDYIMRQRAGNVVLGLKTYSSDTLPAAIKLKIGLLKLLEDNHYMKDVGYRLDAANFYVLVDPD